MRRRTLVNGAVVGTVLVTSIGIGVAISFAATSPAIPKAGASAGPSASGRVPSSGTPTASASATGSAGPSASSSSSGGSECADVFLVAKPAGDPVGKLCTAITNSSTGIDNVVVTFTAASKCGGSVSLRVSGADQNGAEFAVVKTATCGSGAAKATFEPVDKVAADTFICGMLLSDKFTAAQACVAIS
jgi:hypothetical protein